MKFNKINKENGGVVLAASRNVLVFKIGKRQFEVSF